MRVLCCYANLQPATERSLHRNVPPEWLSLVDVSRSGTAYWEEIEKRWTGDEDLLVIEQDIDIHAEVLSSFIRCYEPWCSFSYELRECGNSARLTESLGCTRFSAKLQKAVSPGQIAGSHHWTLLDHQVKRALSAAGYSVHVHGQVKHHHYIPCGKRDCQSCDVIHHRRQV